jgi:hypothetical protein
MLIGQPNQFKPFVFARTGRRLLPGAFNVLNTVVLCENKQSGVGCLLFVTVLVIIRSIR